MRSLLAPWRPRRWTALRAMTTEKPAWLPACQRNALDTRRRSPRRSCFWLLTRSTTSPAKSSESMAAKLPRDPSGFRSICRMNITKQTTSEQSRVVVDTYYQAGVRGRLTDFAPYVHPDFSTTAPNYLPLGGVHVGAAYFRDEVLSKLPDVLDYGRYSYDTFMTEY